ADSWSPQLHRSARSLYQGTAQYYLAVPPSAKGPIQGREHPDLLDLSTCLMTQWIPQRALGFANLVIQVHRYCRPLQEILHCPHRYDSQEFPTQLRQGQKLLVSPHFLQKQQVCPLQTSQTREQSRLAQL